MTSQKKNRVKINYLFVLLLTQIELNIIFFYFYILNKFPRPNYNKIASIDRRLLFFSLPVCVCVCAPILYP